MADRRDIREAFYGELETAVSDITDVGPENISQETPDSDEELPAIVHNDDYRPATLNGISGPRDIETDANGNDAAFVFYSMMEAQFGVAVLDPDEQRKESIYEALRRQFERYEHPWWDTTDLHADIHDVTVQDATSDDDDDREPIVRGDRVIVRLGYKRDYRVVRADLADGSEDATYDSNIEEVVHDIEDELRTT
jgi:hypothetical protein